MQIIKSLFKLVIFIFPVSALAQTTYLQQGDKAYTLLERLEIKAQKNPNLNFSTLKYFSRKAVVPEVQALDSINKTKATDKKDASRLTAIDEFNIQSFFMANSEWYTGNKDGFASKRPVLKTFYKTKPNFYEVNTKDFFMAINPMIQFSYGKESGNTENIFYNSRGATVRGLIANKIGFSTTATDNQERGPRFFQDTINKMRAVPGYGFYKDFKKTAVDYFDVRGYVTFSATKYIDIQFGHDKNFIGNGYRSLFLSDWGNSYLFLKLNTRIWKLNYQNIFMELMPVFDKSGGDRVLDKKYQAIHHLSMNVSKSVTVGVFEAVTFGRRNHFDFQYLNPIIFLRPVESGNGSGDKAKVGFDFKANVANRFQFYGQFLFDEFVLGKLKNDKNNYVNKYGYQLGAKYIDAFGIPNLDLQIETNRVRPFTYTHYDSVSTYTHYNQPMAHPLGANFQEYIGILRYQPIKKLHIYARAIYYYQGLDSAGYNFGSNPFELYNENRPPTVDEPFGRTSGFKVGGGVKATCLNALLQVSYELKENLYIDLSLQQRTYKAPLINLNTSNTMFTAGIRLNMFKRTYDF